MDWTIDRITVAINDEFSHLSYFLGYENPPFDQQGSVDDFHMTFSGRIAFPEELGGLRCKIALDPVVIENRRRRDKEATIGTLSITDRECHVTLNLEKGSIDRILQHYFVFRERDCAHFQISLQLRDCQITGENGKRWCGISKLFCGWGE